MSHDDDRRGDFRSGGGLENVLDHGTTDEMVEGLGASRTHARALARRQDHDAHGTIHTSISTSRTVRFVYGCDEL